MQGIFSTQHVNDVLTDKVSDSIPFASKDDVNRALPTQDMLRYIKNDVNVADVTSLLGRVFYENKGDKKLKAFALPVNAILDEKSILNAPQVVSELIINNKVKASVDALSFLSISTDGEELVELRIINNAAARATLSGDAWPEALTKWLAHPLCIKLVENKNVGMISIVTGVVQKYITSKKYRKFDASAKGGGMGVNAEGSLYTSTSQFELTVLYGLELIAMPGVETAVDFIENISNSLTIKDAQHVEKFNTMFSEMAATKDSIFSVGGGADF